MTGMPRSGTTWLSRLLATAPGTALTGREPMNPRERQWALAGSLDGWTRLRDPNGKQARALRRAYRGLAPGVYSSFGFRQWRGPLPNSRLIVKDPFAMLSMPAIHTITGARPVLVYRHPGAMLVSYRRMGWAPDVAELAPIAEEFIRAGGPTADLIPPSPADGDVGSAAAMAWFWSALYAIAVADVTAIPGGAVVSHEAVAMDKDVCRRLHDELAMPWSAAAEAEFGRAGSGPIDPGRLHNLDRRPSDVAQEWRTQVTETELAVLENATAALRDRIDGLAFHLGAS